MPQNDGQKDLDNDPNDPFYIDPALVEAAKARQQAAKKPAAPPQETAKKPAAPTALIPSTETQGTTPMPTQTAPKAEPKAKPAPKAKAAPKAKTPPTRLRTAIAKPTKARKPTKPAKPAKAPKAKAKGTKLEQIVALMKRASGCTRAEVLAATGWPSVSMPQQAEAGGLKLRKEKLQGKPTRYFGK